MAKSKYTVFWFRRDLRLEDNCGLFHALSRHTNVLPIFIFDPDILDQLEKPFDRRVTFIHQNVERLQEELKALGSNLIVLVGRPLDALQELRARFDFSSLYLNHDYEPYARKRDSEVRSWAQSLGIHFQSFKDQCIFEQSEVLTDQSKPYTVFTPYKKKWLSQLNSESAESFNIRDLQDRFARLSARELSPVPSLRTLGFQETQTVDIPPQIPKGLLKNYADTRNFPALQGGTSQLGVHLRFGTVSIRDLVRQAQQGGAETWLSELIWREFFMQILWHYPRVTHESFRPEYDKVAWRSNEDEFKRWRDGQTGYPLVDAGMRQLRETGLMHNRVRMTVASFLCKHLLMHWSLGERYFSLHLLDFELASNNGNWQWAAGTGCDAAPYFRIFNPESQQKKFDPQNDYIRKWVPEYGTSRYAKPIVEHKFARERCLQAFKKALHG